MIFRWLRNRRRKKLRTRPIPGEWRRLLERSFPLFARLGEEDRRELEALIQVFLGEKRIEGCGGLDLTDEMRLLIAAQACLLILRLGPECYPGLSSILVYPSAYFASRPSPAGHGIIQQSGHVRLGESWTRGPVVLAWDAIDHSVGHPSDGRNVVFHEFAHQLDQADGYADGAPDLSAGSPREDLRGRYSTWARVLGAEYESLRRSKEKGLSMLLDEYGATNPAEFFAVATECFFEKPRPLKAKHPALYEELRRFYRQDPASWSQAAPRETGLRTSQP